MVYVMHDVRVSADASMCIERPEHNVRYGLVTHLHIFLGRRLSFNLGVLSASPGDSTVTVLRLSLTMDWGYKCVAMPSFLYRFWVVRPGGLQPKGPSCLSDKHSATEQSPCLMTFSFKQK